jgi:hypothetical protein
MVAVDAEFGGGRTRIGGARLYVLDDDGKITHEPVVFFAGS